MPTCKQCSYKDLALLIEMLHQAWRMSPYDEALNGPIWSMASDGDPEKLQRNHKDVADLNDERPAKRPRNKTSHNASYASGTQRNFATGPGPYVG